MTNCTVVSKLPDTRLHVWPPGRAARSKGLQSLTGSPSLWQQQTIRPILKKYLLYEAAFMSPALPVRRRCKYCMLCCPVAAWDISSLSNKDDFEMYRCNVKIYEDWSCFAIRDECYLTKKRKEPAPKILWKELYCRMATLPEFPAPRRPHSHQQPHHARYICLACPPSLSALSLSCTTASDVPASVVQIRQHKCNLTTHGITTHSLVISKTHFSCTHPQPDICSLVRRVFHFKAYKP